jgi:hypothetical protein
MRTPSWRRSRSVRILLVALCSGFLLGEAFPVRARADAEADRKAEIEALKKAQAELLERVKAQQARIDELERRVSAASPPAAPSAAAAPGGRDPGAPVKWNELVAGSSRLKFYGFLRMDGVFDDSRPNNTQTIGWVRSEDPAAPPGIGNAEDEEDLTFYPRLTRFGIDLDGPVLGALGGAKLTGRMEVDFYNNGLLGQSESRQAPRLRHAYVKLGWAEGSVLAGQTDDVISPIFPIVNNDLVMWGAGNLGDRRPQIRGEWLPALGPGRLVLQGEVGPTGSDDNADLDPAGTFGAGFRDGETSALPTLQARVAWRVPGSGKQNFEIGLWGHRAWERPDTEFAGHRRFDSDALGMDLAVPLWEDRLWFKGEAWRGRNVDDVRGGIFQGINGLTGREIASRGGWAEVGLQLLPWYAIHGGYSVDDPDNGDLPAGGRAANRIFYLANRFRFDPVEFGLDYMNWTTDYVGLGEGDDNRFQLFIAYRF